LAVRAFDPDPIAVAEAQALAQLARDEQGIARLDLPQPGILPAPGMIHVHRALGDRVQHVTFAVGRRAERRIPARQRVEPLGDARAQMLRRLTRAVAFGRELELAQGLGIKLQHDLLRLVEETARDRPFEEIAVGEAIEARLLRNLSPPEAAILDIAVELPAVRLAHALLVLVVTA